MTINGYTLEKDEWETRGGGGQCNFCRKNGERFFIKRLLSPKYPESDKFDESYRRDKMKECEKWLNTRNRIIKALPGTGSGNLVKPIEYFRDGPVYYEVSRAIDPADVKVSDIHKESKTNLTRLMLTISKTMADLNAASIVHGDMDPGNIVISKTTGGNLVCKLIDLTDAFFENEVPNEIKSKEYWWSPEMALFTQGMKQEPNPFKEFITTKTDVFSLGIIFHQYLSPTGEGPICDTPQPWMSYQAGKAPRVDPSIDKDFAIIIEKMIKCEPSERPTMAEVHRELYDMDRNSTKPTPTLYVPGDQLNGKGAPVKDISMRNAKKMDLYFTDGSQQLMDIHLALSIGYIKRK